MNMSYCRFQNTKQDLIDCRDNINDYEMSKEELRARNVLIEICKEIIEEAEEIKEEDLEEE
jgi:hypothetical protein